MKRSSGGMVATHTASRADTVAWISTRQSKVRDDAVAMPHQPAPRADQALRGHVGAQRLQATYSATGMQHMGPHGPTRRL
jgi:hypothetical protein